MATARDGLVLAGKKHYAAYEGGEGNLENTAYERRQRRRRSRHTMHLVGADRAMHGRDRCPRYGQTNKQRGGSGWNWRIYYCARLPSYINMELLGMTMNASVRTVIRGYVPE